jgi:membrane-associated phospholipid phosphatase
VEASFVEWLNRLMHAHPLLAGVVVQFSTWGVPTFGVLAVGLWLLSPPGDRRWKRACVAGLSAAALGLLVNQAISHVWDRGRPYEAHPSVVPLLQRTSDASFPSDHATAALSIAFGVFFISRRAGGLFLAFAALVSASRVMAGMHYPTDVLGSLAVSLAAAYFCARIAMEPVLVPMILAVSRVSDPVLARVACFAPVRRTVLEPRIRTAVVGVLCAFILVRIVAAVYAHVFDEMELAVMAAWIAVSLVAIQVSAHRFWPPTPGPRTIG